MSRWASRCGSGGVTRTRRAARRSFAPAAGSASASATGARARPSGVSGWRRAVPGGARYFPDRGALRRRAARIPVRLALACAAIVAAGWVADQAGLPSSYLFVAIVVGIAIALLTSGLELPKAFFPAGQAVAGVVVGTYLHTDTLTELGTRWIPVALVSAATLAITIAAGVLLARIAPVDRATASLGMVAGGASGIVAMADDLGADDRIVAFMQYLRLAVVVLVTPLIVGLAFSAHGRGAAPGGEQLLGQGTGWAWTIGLAAAGAVIGARLRLPAAAFLGPTLIAAVLTLGGVADFSVPPLLREASFAAIG